MFHGLGVFFYELQEWSRAVPTAYSYGYLWAAQTLFYWRRDQAIARGPRCLGSLSLSRGF